MKKTTCRILAALIIGYLPAHLSAVGCAAETSEISNLQGDLNSDGEINAADALIFKKWLMGTSDIKNSEIPAADLNNDGKVNIADFCLLKSKILETSENESSGIVNPSEKRKITLNDILRLSHKGSELDWSDFEEYEYTDFGSGLYFYEYRLEESEYKDYVLSVSGLPEQKPKVLLIPAEYGSSRYCDIISSSEEQIKAFLKGNNSEQNYISGFDALSLHKHCNYSLKSISVESLPGGYSYSFNNDNLYKVWDYLSDLKLISDFPENPDEYDGMTWVITLACAAGHTETIYHFGNMFIRDENGSWYKMDYDQASEFQALLEELECN